MIRFAIIDDEPIAHRIIENYCQDLPFMKKIGNCFNAMEAIDLLNKESVDLLFLDINMPKFSGFEFLKMLNSPPKVIVTSAHKEYALEGFELDVVDYLLKPFSFARFVKAVDKLSSLNQVVERPNSSINVGERQTLFVKSDRKQYQVQLSDLMFVEAAGNYCKVHLHDQVIITHEKISFFEKILPQHEFIRVHKSYIVSQSAIKVIEGNRLNIGDQYIPISQSYKTRLRDMLGE